MDLEDDVEQDLKMLLTLNLRIKLPADLKGKEAWIRIWLWGQIGVGFKSVHLRVDFRPDSQVDWLLIYFFLIKCSCFYNFSN